MKTETRKKNKKPVSKTFYKHRKKSAKKKTEKLPEAKPKFLAIYDTMGKDLTVP